MFATIGLFQGNEDKLVAASLAPVILIARAARRAGAAPPRAAVALRPAAQRDRDRARRARARCARACASSATRGWARGRPPRSSPPGACSGSRATSLLVALGLDERAGIGAAAAVLFAVNVTAVLPATPSNLGVFQAACVAVLSAYGVGHSDAFAYGIILQAVEMGTAFAMGMPALVREGMTWKDMRLRAHPRVTGRPAGRDRSEDLASQPPFSAPRLRYLSRGAVAGGETGVVARACARLRVLGGACDGRASRRSTREASRPTRPATTRSPTAATATSPSRPARSRRCAFWYGPYVMPAGLGREPRRPRHPGPQRDDPPGRAGAADRPRLDGAEPPGRAHPPRALVRARPGQQGGQLHRRQHRVDLRQRRRGDAGRTSCSGRRRRPEGPDLRRVHRPRRAAGDDLHAPQQDRAADGRLHRARRHLQARHDRAAQRGPAASTTTSPASCSGAPSTSRASAKGDGAWNTTEDMRTRRASRGRSSGPRRSTAR